MNKILPLLKVIGNNYEIGFNIGQEFKDRIKRAFKQSIIFNSLKKYDESNPEWFNCLQAETAKKFPQYVKEMQGIADGSTLSYRDIALGNFRHSFPPISQLECSTVLFKKNNSFILGHNEDHEGIFSETSYLLNVTLDNETRFLTFSYPGCLPGNSFGFNSHGIVITGNAISRPRARMGFPRVFIDRSLLEAKTIKEIIDLVQTRGRSGSFSYNIVSLKEKKALNIEISSKKCGMTKIDDNYFHTNHFISERLKKFSIVIGSTKRRFERGVELLPDSQKTPEAALKILSDDKILVKIKKSQSLPSGNLYSGTLYQVIFEISEDIKMTIFSPFNKDNFMKFSLEDIV